MLTEGLDFDLCDVKTSAHAHVLTPLTIAHVHDDFNCGDSLDRHYFYCRPVPSVS